MATAPRPFLATAPATRIARVANTTLFALAARYYDNALYWTVIAEANGLVDPWVQDIAELRIPNLPLNPNAPTGMLEV